MRYYGIDVRNAIYDYLEANYNNMIDTINTERTLLTPHIKSIIINQRKNQFPEMYIDITSSRVDNETITTDREIFTMEIIVMLKTNDTNILDYCEVYIEGLIRLLNNKGNQVDTNIDYIFATDTMRDFFDNNGEILRVCGVRFEIMTE